MTIYQKILSVFNLVNSLIGRRAARSELAGTFSASKTYVVGALVVYEDQLYCCTADHTGTWNLSHFSKATVNDALALKSGNGSGGHDIAVIDETLVINKGKDSGDSGSGDSGSGDSGTGGTVDLSGYYTSEQTDALLDKKVDKVDGKGLSTNDFTDKLKEKLDDIDLSGYAKTADLDGYAKTADLDGYVKAETGKGLSTNDFTDALKKKLENLSESGTGGTVDLSGYVTKDDLSKTLDSYATTARLDTVIAAVNDLSSQVSSANSRLEAIA